MFGDESVWEEEERNRIIGNADIYGKSGDGDMVTSVATTEERNENDDDDDINGNDSFESEKVDSDMD